MTQTELHPARLDPAPRVYLPAGDESGWAIDEDRRLTRQGLDGLVQFVDEPGRADVVHACWWEPMMALDADSLRGRHVLCQLDDRLSMHLAKPAFQGALGRVTRWIAQNRSAVRDLSAVASAISFVPYAVDFQRYQGALPEPNEHVARALEELDRLDPGTYVIASFQRDTLGEPLRDGRTEPKSKKGPDVLVRILAELRQRGRPVVALLSSPRRHWIRDELARVGVPFVFAGPQIKGDDYEAMIEQMPPEQLAILYRRADLFLTCSRAEGGPRGVLEAGAAGTAQISSPCGLAPDVLPPDLIYHDAMRAVELIEQDMDDGLIRRWAPSVRETIRANHTPEANRPRWAALYRDLMRCEWPDPPLLRSRRVRSVLDSPRRVCIWHEFTTPPWGGGNQFLIAFRKQAHREGIEVTVNGQGPPATAHLIHAVWFDHERFASVVEAGQRVVHRVDGPLSLIRRTPEALDLDRRCYRLNREHACATVLQSPFMLEATRSLGFDPVRPVVVPNACDPEIFHRADRVRSPGGPIRLIAASWSPNPGKGAAVYARLARILDPDRVRFTLVGNCPIDAPGLNRIEPVGSRELADLFREHDVFITASRDDPCSNALIEALSCGLPAIYLDHGGHGDLVRFAGLPFTHPEQVPALLDRIVAHHEAYRSMIAVESIKDVAAVYLRLLFGDQAYRP